jgi:hypothetical protein
MIAKLTAPSVQNLQQKAGCRDGANRFCRRKNRLFTNADPFAALAGGFFQQKSHRDPVEIFCGTAVMF